MRSRIEGSAQGSVRWALRLEGLVVLAAASVLYARSGAGWGHFAAWFLVPDLSMAGYLFGPKVGAASYNALHSLIGPLGLGTLALAGLVPAALLPLAFIWAAHVGFDRTLGYGLKYATAFGDTHLGVLNAPRGLAAGTVGAQR